MWKGNPQIPIQPKNLIVSGWKEMTYFCHFGIVMRPSPMGYIPLGQIVHLILQWTKHNPCILQMVEKWIWLHPSKNLQLFFYFHRPPDHSFRVAHNSKLPHIFHPFEALTFPIFFLSLWFAFLIIGVGSLTTWLMSSIVHQLWPPTPT